MENNNQKPRIGTWDKMQTGFFNAPQLKFDKIGQRYTVTLLCAHPREVEWDDGCFYVFDIEHNGEKKVIQTSAWSLLKGLKEIEKTHGSLYNCEVAITKTMDKQKQSYLVEDLSKVEEERVV